MPSKLKVAGECSTAACAMKALQDKAFSGYPRHAFNVKHTGAGGGFSGFFPARYRGRTAPTGKASSRRTASVSNIPGSAR